MDRCFNSPSESSHPARRFLNSPFSERFHGPTAQHALARISNPPAVQWGGVKKAKDFGLGPMAIADQIKELLARGLKSRALECCEKLIEQQIQDPDVWYLTATLQRDAGRNNAAKGAFQRAVELAPDHHPFRREQAQHAMAMQDHRLAAGAIKAIDEKHRLAQDWKILAQANWLEGKYHSALDLFKRAYQQQPAGPIAASLVQTWFSLGCIAEARELIDSHLRQHSADPQLLLFCSLLQVQSGEKDQALSTMAQCMRLFPNFAVGQVAYQVLKCLAVQPTGAWAEVDLAAKHPRIKAMVEGFAYQRKFSDSAQLFGVSVVVLQDALERMRDQGLIVECGVYWGRSLGIIASHDSRRQVHGFDSFQGLPEAWKKGERQGHYSTGGQLPQVGQNVELHVGWFEHTLPVFAQKQSQALALLHIDCDLYRSTMTVLESLRPLMQVGTIIVLDDYLGFPGYEDHEFRALREFCDRHCIRYQYLSFALLGREAALRITQVGSVE